MNPENEFDHPYCLTCGSCGEEECCNPLNCSQENEEYCEINLSYLKFGYAMYQGIGELLNKHKDKYPDLMEEYNELFDKTYDKYHT